jgi:hypothetical protein
MKNYTQAELNAIVHTSVESAITGLSPHANATTDSGIRQRLAAAISGGYDFADTLHNIYLDFGYPLSLDFSNFWNMYRRFGIARRVVELYPDQTWLDDPEVEGGTAFDAALEKLNQNLGLWRRLKGLDTRQRVGRYAGLFMRVRDNLSPDKPIAGRLPGPEALVDMVPLYESQLKVASVQDDPLADDFGMPKMYQFNSGVAGNRNEKAASSFQIHPSRIIIASEDSDNSGIYGIPVLESIYNSLMDLRKVLGGGGEGFYKNAAQSVVFDLKDAASAKANSALLTKFNEQYDEFSQNRSRRAIWTPGMDTKVLDSNLINPKEFAANSLMDIAAGSNIPTALLIGNQTGRLAGDQDTKGFLSQVQARRTDFGTDMVTSTLDWMITWGILPAADYEVEWPDAMAPSADEKADNAVKLATINKTQYESGGDVPFTGAEIREAAGYEPEEMPEGLPDETLTPEEIAAAADD